MTTRWAGTDTPEIRFYTSEDAAPMACSRCGSALGADPFSTGPDGAACSRCRPIVLPTPAQPRCASAPIAANRLLARAGLMLVPRLSFTGKALHEVVNVTETHHPAGGYVNRCLGPAVTITDESRPRDER